MINTGVREFAIAAMVAAMLASGLGAQQGITIPDRVACAECRIELEKVVALGKSTDSVLLTFGSRFAIDEPGGRIFAGPTATEGRIAVFDKSGTLLGTVGRLGKGPGELATVDGLVSQGGRLYVIDMDNSRIAVYGNSLDFEHSFQFNGGFEVRPELTVLPSGFALAPLYPTPERAGSVHLLDRQGKFVRAVGGPAPPRRSPSEMKGDMDGGIYSALRTVADAGSGRFWTSTMSKYELELWDTTGVRHLIATRNASWFPPWQTIPERWWVAGLPPMVHQIHQSADGVLWTLIVVPDTRIKSRATNTPPNGTEMAGLMDVIVEAIDPRAGTLLATRRLDDPSSLTAGSGYIAQFAEDADGYVTWTISRLVLRRPR